MARLASKAWWVVMAVAMALLAPVQASAQDAPAQPVTLSGGYLLGANDLIDVGVLGRDDFKARVQVQADGTVPLPLIGSLTVANKTVTQVRDEIRRRLVEGGFFTAPEVVVTVASAVSRYVVVLGEVGSPGLLPVDREYSLSELIARAGGLRGTGTDAVTLTLASGASTKYSLQAITTGQVPDPVVNPGDKVFVAPPETFYIYGQVGNPGSYPIDAGMTVRRALARGGGLTALGSEKRIKLYRGDAVVRAGLDEPLKPGDTIVVGERFF